MADGYARVSGRHGVVIGQNGPGISNCVTAIAAAFWAHSPVVIVTPEAGTMGMGLGGFQEANQLPMFQEFTKYQGHVNNPQADGRVHRTRASTARCRRWARRSSTFPATTSTARSRPRSRKPSRLDRGAGGAKSLDEAAELLADGRVPGDHLRRRRGDGRRASRNARRSPNASARRWSTATCTTTPSPPATRCGAARWATRAPRRR